MQNNPLLDFSDLPRFDKIQAENITSAIDQLISEADAVVEKIINNQQMVTWQNTMLPLTDVGERLNRAWGVVSHLNSVLNSSQLRDAFNNNLPKISLYWTRIGQNLALFQRFEALKASEKYKTLSLAQQKVLDNDLRDFCLSGAKLSSDNKLRFATIQTRLSELSAKFEQNVLDATDAFSIYVEDEKQLAGLPTDVLAMFADAAKADGKSAYKINLQMPFYLPLMQYCENRSLREQLYKAYVTRASDFSDSKFDNTSVIYERLPLLREEAALLGYESYAELSLETKMANSPQQVLDFLRDLAKKAKPFALRDLSELRDFANKLALPELQAWDISFVSEKLREERYAFSEQEVKQYFPEHAVLSGLFALVKELYSVEIKPFAAPVWHPDVSYFQLLENSQVIGGFYLDLYAREGKRGGAWMDDARSRRWNGIHLQTPVAYLTCNFSRPVEGKTALFTHDEVITLFHEFGHGLHHLLTKVDELAVSGINGVEWDAVELPSQFMENFCWEWDVICQMSSHVDSGDKLPKALFDKMLSAKNFQSGLQTVRQIEFALFDMLLHVSIEPNIDYIALLNLVRDEVSVLFPPTYNRFANSFGHIFAGGYSAGYYSYKWAELLSADAYSLFEENQSAKREIGELFRNEILARGGSRSALESFVAFRGREPQMDAMLRHSGMINDF